MATRVFTSTTTKGMIEAQRTQSANTPGEGLASYFDPFTGEIITGATPVDVLQAMDKAGLAVMDKDSVLIPLIDNGELKGRLIAGGPRNAPGTLAQEWDVLSFDLTGQPDIMRAREIIIEALRKPDATLTKNPGGGAKIQTIDFHGQRAVLNWAIHTDQEAGPHFQVYVHGHVLREDGTVSSKATFKDSYARGAFEKDINDRLTRAGLNPVAISLGASTDNVEAREAGLKAEHNEEFQQAAAKGEVPPLMEGEELPALDTASETDLVRRALKHFEQEAAKNWAKAQADQQRAHTLGKALTAIKAEQDLRQRVDSLTHEVRTAREAAAAATLLAAKELADSRAETVKAEALADELGVKLTQTSGQLAEVNETLLAREKDLESAESTIDDLNGSLREITTQAEALLDEKEALAVRVAEEEGNARTAQAKAEEEAAQRAQAEKDHAEALAVAQTALASAQGQAQELGKELDATRTQARDLAGERDDFKAQAEQAKRNHERSEERRKTEAQEHAEALARMKDERDAAKRHTREALGEKVKAESQIDRLNAELENRPTAQVLAQAQAEARREAEARAQAETERQTMAEEMAKLRQELAAARAEGAQVTAELAQRPTVEDMARITSQRDQAQALVVRYRELLDEKPGEDPKPRGPGVR